MPKVKGGKIARMLERKKRHSDHRDKSIFNKSGGIYTGYNQKLEPICIASVVDRNRLDQFEKDNVQGFKIGDWFIAHDGDGNPYRTITGPFKTSSDAIDFCISVLDVSGFEFRNSQ